MNFYLPFSLLNLFISGFSGVPEQTRAFVFSSPCKEKQNDIRTPFFLCFFFSLLFVLQFSQRCSALLRLQPQKRKKKDFPPTSALVIKCFPRFLFRCGLASFSAHPSTSCFATNGRHHCERRSFQFSKAEVAPIIKKNECSPRRTPSENVLAAAGNLKGGPIDLIIRDHASATSEKSLFGIRYRPLVSGNVRCSAPITDH